MPFLNMTSLLPPPKPARVAGSLVMPVVECPLAGLSEPKWSPL